ncbi:MAG: HNH endonuclease [Halobacteriales archaeon]|nr:HNH endonuclease [Halobacteriales archaeon]
MRPFSLRADMAAYLGRRDGAHCQLCGGPFGLGLASLTLDHIIPRSRGGTNHPANLRLAHFLCSNLRGSPMPPPEEVERILRASQGRVDEAWRAAGVELRLRRSQRRSRFTRALRASGALQPGEVVAALAMLFD